MGQYCPLVQILYYSGVVRGNKRINVCLLAQKLFFFINSKIKEDGANLETFETTEAELTEKILERHLMLDFIQTGLNKTDLA